MSLYTFTSKQKVSFFDCDPMGVVWHGNYLKYLEVARGEFLQMINFSYTRIRDIDYAFPIVDIKLKYTHSLRIDKQFDVITTLEEYENRLVHGFKIISDNNLCLKAISTQVAFNSKTNTMEFIMPQEFRDAVLSFIEGK